MTIVFQNQFLIDTVYNTTLMILRNYVLLSYTSIQDFLQEILNKTLKIHISVYSAAIYKEKLACIHVVVD